MKDFEKFIEVGRQQVGRYARNIGEEFRDMTKQEFVAHVQAGNIADVAIVPFEDERFLSSGHPMFGTMFVGTRFGTRYQSRDFAGNIRETFYEETDFHNGTSLAKREVSRINNIEVSMERASSLQVICPEVMVTVNDPIVMKTTI